MKQISGDVTDDMKGPGASEVCFQPAAVGFCRDTDVTSVNAEELHIRMLL